MRIKHSLILSIVATAVASSACAPIDNSTAAPVTVTETQVVTVTATPNSATPLSDPIPLKISDKKSSAGTRDVPVNGVNMLLCGNVYATLMIKFRTESGTSNLVMKSRVENSGDSVVNVFEATPDMQRFDIDDAYITVKLEDGSERDHRTNWRAEMTNSFSVDSSEFKYGVIDSVTLCGVPHS